jgi:Ca-activated chloride channel homolog
VRRLALFGLLVPLLGSDVTAGNRAYREGNPRVAASVYARLLAEGDSSAALRYNLGTALLRTGRWDEARAQLEAAAALPTPPQLALRAHYNAGTADLLPVHRRDASAAEERKARLTRAISRYKQALRIAPGDLDSKWNLEIAQKLLDQEESGASDQPEGGGGGGGGGGEDENDDQQPDPQPGPPTPSPQPQGDADAPQLSPAEAERILSGAATRERNTQREILDRNRATPRPARDW